MAYVKSVTGFKMKFYKSLTNGIIFVDSYYADSDTNNNLALITNDLYNIILNDIYTLRDKHRLVQSIDATDYGNRLHIYFDTNYNLGSNNITITDKVSFARFGLEGVVVSSGHILIEDYSFDLFLETFKRIMIRENRLSKK